ncbi:MAG TPA: hypothetical protein VIU61_22105 [Kofleriaceae bacterium]
MRWVFAAALLGGCHVLFELEPIPRTVVTGRLVEAYVVNNELHEPMRTNDPVAVGLLVGRARFDDGSESTVTFDPDGSFRFERPPGATYELSILVAGQPIDLRHSAEDLQLITTAFGRKQRLQMAQPTLIEFPSPLEVTDLFPTVTSTGIWASLGNVVTSVDWRNVTFVGPASLLSGEDHDALYYHVSAGVPPPPSSQYYAISKISTAFPQLMDGSKFTLPAFDPVLPARCTKIQMDIGGEVGRLTAAYDTRIDVRSLGGAAIIQAYVDLDLGSLGSQLVAFSAANQEAAVTAGLAMQHPDPFPGTTLVAAVQVSLDHAIQYPGATPLRHRLLSIHIAPIPEGGTCPTVAIASEAATAIDWQIGETTLSGENQVVSIDPTARVPVRFTADGRAEVISLKLFEIVATNGLTLFGPQLSAIRSVEPDFTFDPALLESGHSYAFLYAVSFGLPGAADGDLRTTEYPTGLVQGVSPVFQIQ